MASRYEPIPDADSQAVPGSTDVPSPHSFHVVMSCHCEPDAICEARFDLNRVTLRARREDVSLNL